MGIPEKSAFVVLVIVVASVVTCALFVCREAPELEKTLRPATQLEPVLPAVVPAVIVDEDDRATTQAAPRPVDGSQVPATQRWYRRRGLAPRWMMRTREAQLERARGARVRRDDREPELRVDLLEDTLRPAEKGADGTNEDDDAGVR